ncbi:MAG: hypothetical protein HC877_23985 [Thioploca sp.]|nr:hypothetical protein [Thioploca sp.]
MKDYKFNGYLVQGSLYSWIIEQNSIYRGVGCGQPWPLDDPDLLDNDPKATLLTKVTEEYFPCFVDGKLGIHVIPDIQFVNEYVAYCNTKGISTRVLLCASELEFPLLQDLNNPTTEVSLLGFDYTHNSFEFSILADDLSEPEIPELSRFRNCINKYGLFDNPDECATYIEYRRQLIKQGFDLEPDDNCMQFKVYELRYNVIELSKIE